MIDNLQVQKEKKRIFHFFAFVLQLSSRNNASRRGPDHCAQLIRQPSEVFLASGVARSINITVQNLPDRFTEVEVNLKLLQGVHRE